ncbi:MAG: hypothetical protein KDA78_02095 [Planctomycetaceae bacterium]|nr:hypothetical protein [Planctomycetaceae bacterium]
MNRIHNSGCDKLRAPLFSDFSHSVEENLKADAEQLFSIPQRATVFTPDQYEPKYAYPLVVHLSSEQSSTSDFLETMEQLSPQNYLGLDIANAEKLLDCSAEIAQQHLKSMIGQVQRHYNVHSERILLMGSGPQGTQALHLFLNSCDAYWGFIALDPTKTTLPNLQQGFRSLRNRLGLILASEENQWVRPAAELLHDAGVHMHLERQSAEILTSPVLHRKAAKSIDHVVITNIWRAGR